MCFPASFSVPSAFFALLSSPRPSVGSQTLPFFPQTSTLNGCDCKPYDKYQSTLFILHSQSITIFTRPQGIPSPSQTPCRKTLFTSSPARIGVSQLYPAFPLFSLDHHHNKYPPSPSTTTIPPSPHKHTHLSPSRHRPRPRNPPPPPPQHNGNRHLPRPLPHPLPRHLPNLVLPPPPPRRRQPKDRIRHPRRAARGRTQHHEARRRRGQRRGVVGVPGCVGPAGCRGGVDVRLCGECGGAGEVV